MLPSDTFPRGVPTLHTDASGTAPPDAFGPFRVLHQIGAGVLGPVFRAYQPDPGRLVAVKQFQLDIPPTSALRFVAALERLIAADLTHMGIAAPLAAGLSDQTPYLALDFVAAESFDVVIRDYGPAPVTEALRIAAQLGGALDFAAAVHVFHGALHPRDVLVSADDTRVTGLGIVQALEEVAFVPPIRRPYTAPERIAGGPWDRRADTFSLAALVYEMLFGRRIPGAGPDAADAVTPIDGTDHDVVRALFSRALAEDPAERFETSLGFAQALHGALAQPATPPKAPRGRRRKDAAPDAAAVPASPARPARPSLPLDIELPAASTARDALDLDLRPSRRAAPPEAASSVAVSGPDLDTFASVTEPPSAVDDPLEGPPAAREPIAAPLDDEQRPFVHAEPDTTERRRFSLDEPAASASLEPALPAPGPAADAPPVHAPTFSSVALEEGRSAIWPIALALTVGLLVGFAFGYGAGTRERGTQPADTAGTSVPQPAASSPTASSEPAPPAARPPVPVAPPAGRARPDGTSRPQASVPPPPPPARANADAGRLLVRSTPAGARVSVDGRDAGVTPATLRDLEIGTHTVRIAHQGYVTAERRVRIRSTQPAQSIEVDLVAARPARGAASPPAAPERTSGSLMVDSRPAGARVFVDGRMFGTTPLLIDALNVGDHAVRLELDGFTPWMTTTRVAGGERTRVSGSMEQR